MIAPRHRQAAQAGLLLAAGALQTLAFVQTTLWWLPLLGVALLVRCLDRSTAAWGAVLGLSYGTGWMLAGVWWLFVSLHRFGHLPAWLSALAVVALAALLSLYLAAAAAAYVRWRSGRAVVDATLFASLWLLAELARGVLFTGFPWVASGYAWVDAPASAWAPWVGVYGLGACLAWMGALLAQLRQGTGTAGWWPVGLVTAALALPWLVGVPDFTSPTGRISVTLLQTNIPQDEKFAPTLLPVHLESLGRALGSAQGQLVVAPETAVPLLPTLLDELAPGWQDGLKAGFDGVRRAALVGQPLGSFEQGYTNSVVGWGGGKPYRYDKSHLVPFGEFVPPGFRWFTDMMTNPLGDFERGRLDPPPFTVLGQRLGPNVCYEDLFGEELARRFQRAEAAPTILVNVSNIGWFGDTAALPQHLNITRMRTLELQRPMLRSTNTGVTAIVDHRARVTHRLPPLTRDTLDGVVEGREGVTPYAWWAARLGLWPLLALAGLGLLPAGWLARRGRAAS